MLATSVLYSPLTGLRYSLGVVQGQHWPDGCPVPVLTTGTREAWALLLPALSLLGLGPQSKERL